MTAIDQLINRTKQQLFSLEKQYKNNPDKGIFMFAFDKEHRRFDIFTDVSPEEIAELTHSKLVWASCGDGSRYCYLKFFPNNGTLGSYCEANLWHVCSYWTMP